MTDYVRARVPRPGTHAILRTTSRQRAEAKGWEVVDEPTHGKDGRILPDTRLDGRPLKPKTSPAKAAGEKKAAESASNTDTKPSKE